MSDDLSKIPPLIHEWNYGSVTRQTRSVMACMHARDGWADDGDCCRGSCFLCEHMLKAKILRKCADVPTSTVVGFQHLCFVVGMAGRCRIFQHWSLLTNKSGLRSSNRIGRPENKLNLYTCHKVSFPSGIFQPLKITEICPNHNQPICKAGPQNFHVFPVAI